MMTRIKRIPLEAGETLNGLIYYTDDVPTHRVVIEQPKGMTGPVPAWAIEDDNLWEEVPIVEDQG